MFSIGLIYIYVTNYHMLSADNVIGQPKVADNRERPK